MLSGGVVYYTRSRPYIRCMSQHCPLLCFVLREISIRMRRQQKYICFIGFTLRKFRFSTLCVRCHFCWNCLICYLACNVCLFPSDNTRMVRLFFFRTSEVLSLSCINMFIKLCLLMKLFSRNTHSVPFGCNFIKLIPQHSLMWMIVDTYAHGFPDISFMWRGSEDRKLS